MSALIGMVPGVARAEPLGSVTEPVVTRGVDGFGPDAQLVGGIGFGFERKLDNVFLARARLGALYATAPWIVNLGLTAEVGAIAGFGWGAELELSRGATFFGSAGVSRVDRSRWLAHAGLGFTIFGLEWQHVFDGPKPHNALLLEVRLPLGLWWLHKRQEKAEAHAAATPPPPQVKPRTAMPRGPTVHDTQRLGAVAVSGSGSAPRGAASGNTAAATNLGTGPTTSGAPAAESGAAGATNGSAAAANGSAAAANGGVAAANGAAVAANGAAVAANGGVAAANGGVAAANGGAAAANGSAAAANGSAAAANGGVAPANGGVAAANGGAVAANGGVAAANGGVAAA
ncbi:MAG TPA: hypothetical protein VFN67_16925, partial [Polyangiales bacterium]|nr:hypothetical protein [Polyangiales bacterium]